VYLHVKLVSGADLIPMDSNGLSDPYVKVSLVDADKVAYKSMIHRVPFEGQTLNPQWNYGFYIGGSELNLRTTNLQFEVFDYDQWSADDDMGSAEFPLKVFDTDEQAPIRRAANLIKKGGALGRTYGAALSSYNALSPAFLPGLGAAPSEGNAAVPGKEDDEDNDDDEDEDDDNVDSMIGKAGGAESGGVGTPKNLKRGYFGADAFGHTPGAAEAGGRKSLARQFGMKAQTLKSIAGFWHVFNKQRKTQGKALNRKGIFGLDKPLIMQNGERVGQMRWYTRQKAYGDLKVVFNDQSSAFIQECAALVKQAGSFMSMATMGRTVQMTGVGDFLSSKVETAVDTGKRRAVNIVENVLGETKQKLLNDITKDRDMPGGVRKVFQTVLGVYFSEVQQEVLDELAKRLKTLSYSEKNQKQKKNIATTLLHIGINRTFYDYFSWKFFYKKLTDIRAWIMYNDLPYDKSFWGKVRSLGWWLILITKLYSGWGIQAMLYALRLHMLDRTDEWQLFEYISNFKGIQFLSGVIAMIQGVLVFMECAGLVGAGEPHTCDINGPGMEARTVCGGSVGNITCASVIGVGFLSRILLTWYAFYLMRRSFSFGKPIFNDSRLVGAVIEIHEVRKRLKSNMLGYFIKACLQCGREAKTLARQSMRAAPGHEPTPRERFVEAVRLTVEDIKQNDPRWIAKNQGHHTVYVKAKVVAYSVKTGLHTIYFLTGGANASEHEEEAVVAPNPLKSPRSLFVALLVGLARTRRTAGQLDSSHHTFILLPAIGQIYLYRDRQTNVKKTRQKNKARPIYHHTPGVSRIFSVIHKLILGVHRIRKNRHFECRF
jgi:hypothetical protein